MEQAKYHRHLLAKGTIKDPIVAQTNGYVDEGEIS